MLLLSLLLHSTMRQNVYKITFEFLYSFNYFMRCFMVHILLWYTANPSPVMRTGFSLCSISIRVKPVFITGFPANENRFFPVWKYYTGKTLFWPCTGPVLALYGIAVWWKNESLWQEITCNKTCLFYFICSVGILQQTTSRCLHWSWLKQIVRYKTNVRFNSPWCLLKKFATKIN